MGFGENGYCSDGENYDNIITYHKIRGGYYDPSVN